MILCFDGEIVSSFCSPGCCCDDCFVRCGVLCCCVDAFDVDCGEVDDVGEQGRLANEDGEENEQERGNGVDVYFFVDVISPCSVCSDDVVSERWEDSNRSVSICC